MSEVIVYQANGPKQGEIWVLRKPTKPNLIGRIGRFLLIAGLIGLFVLIGPFILLEAKWQLKQLQRQGPTTFWEEESEFAKVIQKTDLEIFQPADSQFSLVIPKIGVNSVVFANIPAGNENEYQPLLKKGVIHAAGSFFPGENGTIYIFGHSTDYPWRVTEFNAVFYLLKELEPGDEVNLFYQGRRYLYQVVDKKIVEAGDLSYLKPQTGREEVILQTCWPPGTTWKRLIVIATPRW